MMFKNKEEMIKYSNYLERREFCKKMSLWRVILMFVVSVVATAIAFVTKISWYFIPEDVLISEKVSYCIWCMFAVALNVGIIRATCFVGLRKFAVLFSGSIAAALIVMIENLLLMYAPDFNYITVSSFFEKMTENFINDGIYGTLRFPVMIVATILVSYAYSSRMYYRFVEKLRNTFRSMADCRFVQKLIAIFSVTDEEYEVD